MLPEVIAIPRVFISYSWTSPEHQEWIRALVDRLRGDGIDALLDIYELKEGHDKYAYMERMVTDPGVKKVLVIADRKYSDKADAREGGVGTESMIISQEVYDSVSQEKFIPVVTEFDESGKPYHQPT
jgi:SEFIR domain-containing protein